MVIVRCGATAVEPHSWTLAPADMSKIAVSRSSPGFIGRCNETCWVLPFCIIVRELYHNLSQSGGKFSLSEDEPACSSVARACITYAPVRVTSVSKQSSMPRETFFHFSLCFNTVALLCISCSSWTTDIPKRMRWFTYNHLICIRYLDVNLVKTPRVGHWAEVCLPAEILVSLSECQTTSELTCPFSDRFLCSGTFNRPSL